MEEADAGDSGCTGLDAGGDVGGCDATEGEDRDGRGGGAGLFEEGEPGAAGKVAASDGFIEHGAEEDGVGSGAEGLFAMVGELVEAMAGDGDERNRQAGLGVEGADLDGGEFAGSGGEVDAGGSDSDGKVGAGVDEEPSRGVAEDLEEGAGEVGQIARREVLFAELKEVNAIGCEACRLLDERSPATRIIVGRFTKEGAIGDGVAHETRVHRISVGRPTLVC